MLVIKEDILRRNLQLSASWMLALQYNGYFRISEFIPHAVNPGLLQGMIEIGFTLCRKSQYGFFVVILA